ncbi:UDP-N-acetylmuramoyl-L-alanine--D-glutamate ligase [Companilactobacillus sp.]|jgi:UDP-N-acetylmuramoylalanine--D-glutamate ligase|uniref:UDP-N-acetylmuramoyl-L-alanine--D-glutamate ligase n=1 Tax=Companilactobacillus sp. TaxID=2767905 RepID=UPI0025B81B7D|nr:UDP-N-acetylmuramoyl-L-alanine--D-glutamate ligase [Companilactobacillus sp.]MCH4008447.1 UDP-N-acetylmuramoyl-L-alanine--D-glutamate ligase [Companilactobacillus sp.]MCH4051374.1 UDP-N-acetylmuramoyl-L-alanine--D-glutamate ligase [Companilactobacillus sp.]MCH4076390.1 UDP-N-acetylmuramoyl-L-alanine--D-glutamate ligase [Companilactobacillus sp.]MCH4124965.1 UDP-N-acetylmuramoyl-L-alanine--D-glutamate ligase [Companilactobacillus sp.]MCH4131507.1 UDP-N-acetylmuramoyl-L-alanine--D-glutamate l
MVKDSIYANKKMMVLGLAKSGYAVAKLLKKINCQVTVVDSNPLEGNDEAKALIDDGYDVITGNNDPKLIDDSYDYLVKNPGIPYSNDLIKHAEELDIPVITEPEIAYSCSDATMVGVTGTNGKTTVTTLIQLMLDHSPQFNNSYYAGNIGIPISDVIQKATDKDVVVTELSSFQLEGTIKLHPHVAVLNNIYSAHLDFHKTRENYINAKMHITKNQTPDDYFIVNWNTDEWRKLAKRSDAQIIPFSDQQELGFGAYAFEGNIYYNRHLIMNEEDIRVPGEHNVQNALAAINVAKIFGVSDGDIIEVLSKFAGVKHRIQYVDEFSDRKFYNDSKATNIEATIVALQAFKQPITLIAGGLDRGNTFDDLVPSLKGKVKNIVVYGQTAAKMIDAAKKAEIGNIVEVENLSQAVPEAFKQSSAGDIVLLSPAAASWDQFDTFEQRGDQFIDDVEKLKGNQHD